MFLLVAESACHTKISAFGQVLKNSAKKLDFFLSFDTNTDNSQIKKSIRQNNEPFKSYEKRRVLSSSKPCD